MLSWLYGLVFGPNMPAIDLEAGQNDQGTSPHDIDSDLLLTLTKSRLSGLRILSGLKKIACEEIAKNIRLYVKDERLADLPIHVREMILEELTKFGSCGQVLGSQALKIGDVQFFKNAQDAATRLLSPSTKSLNLTYIICESTREIASHQLHLLLPVVASHAPCLESLAYHSTVFYKSNIGRSKYSCIDEKLQQSILKLMHLRELTLIDCWISLENLMEMCKLLPRLETVQLNIYLSDQFPSDLNVANFKSSLSNLKVLKFAAKKAMCEGGNSQLGQLCVQHLPNLQLIRDKSLSFSCSPNLAEYPPIYQTPSKLRKLAIWESPPFPQELVLKLPYVSELQIKLSPMNQTLPQPEHLFAFQNVTSLELKGVNSVEACHSFITKYGHNLTELSVFSVYPPPTSPCWLTFHNIFSCCPNIEDLFLGINVFDHPEPKMLSAPKLKKLYISGPESSKTVDITPIVIAATSLEKLTLSSIRIEPRDLVLLTRLLANQKILRELAYFDLTDTWQKPEEVEDFPAFSGFIKTLAAFAPKLVKIYLDVGHTEPTYRLPWPIDDEEDDDSDDDFKFWKGFGDPTLIEVFRQLK